MLFNGCHPERYGIRPHRLPSWAATFAMAMTLGCGSAPPPDPHANQMVYFDRATKQAVVYKTSGEMPAIHPQTGKPTLVPAAYCSQCQTWFPSPPIEVRQRNPKAVTCPQRHPLSLDGPWPKGVL